MEQSKINKVKHHHAGHRQRLKNRYLREGLHNFSDHEVLELLLFFAVPQKNINDLAHDLLAEFGSLNAVLEARPEDLMHIKGIGAHCAMLLSLWPDLFCRYQSDQFGKLPVIKSNQQLAEFATSLVMGVHYEAFYLISLDAQNRVTNSCLVHKGTTNEVIVYPRIVVEAALRHKAKSVAFVHNHPSGNLMPTPSDMNLTAKLVDVLRPLDISVVDHIIINNGEYVSFLERNLMIE